VQLTLLPQPLSPTMPESRPGMTLKLTPIDGTHGATGVVKMHAQVLHLEDRLRGPANCDIRQ